MLIKATVKPEIGSQGTNGGFLTLRLLKAGFEWPETCLASFCFCGTEFVRLGNLPCSSAGLVATYGRYTREGLSRDGLAGLLLEAFEKLSRLHGRQATAL